MRATHIPRRPKKKPLRGEKVGFAEKKLRLWLAELPCMAMVALERADGIVGFVVIKFLNIDLRITMEIHKYAYRKLCAK